MRNSAPLFLWISNISLSCVLFLSFFIFLANIYPVFHWNLIATKHSSRCIFRDPDFCHWHMGNSNRLLCKKHLDLEFFLICIFMYPNISQNVFQNSHLWHCYMSSLQKRALFHYLLFKPLIDNWFICHSPHPINYIFSRKFIHEIVTV